MLEVPLLKFSMMRTFISVPGGMSGADAAMQIVPTQIRNAETSTGVFAIFDPDLRPIRPRCLEQNLNRMSITQCDATLSRIAATFKFQSRPHAFYLKNIK